MLSALGSPPSAAWLDCWLCSTAAGASLSVATSAAAVVASLAVTSSCDRPVGCGSAAGVADGSSVTSDTRAVAGSSVDDGAAAVLTATAGAAGVLLNLKFSGTAVVGMLFTDGTTVL